MNSELQLFAMRRGILNCSYCGKKSGKYGKESTQSWKAVSRMQSWLNPPQVFIALNSVEFLCRESRESIHYQQSSMFVTLIWKQGRRTLAQATHGATFKQSTESNLPLPVNSESQLFSEFEHFLNWNRFPSACISKERKEAECAGAGTYISKC